METRTITITGERLMAAYDNDLALYGTPDTYEPYWNSQPSFLYDKVLATADELLDLGGWDEDDRQSLRTDEQMHAFQVQIPA